MFSLHPLIECLILRTPTASALGSGILAVINDAEVGGVVLDPSLIWDETLHRSYETILNHEDALTRGVVLSTVFGLTSTGSHSVGYFSSVPFSGSAHPVELRGA